MARLEYQQFFLSQLTVAITNINNTHVSTSAFNNQYLKLLNYSLTTLRNDFGLFFHATMTQYTGIPVAIIKRPNKHSTAFSNSGNTTRKEMISTKKIGKISDTCAYKHPTGILEIRSWFNVQWWQSECASQCTTFKRELITTKSRATSDWLIEDQWLISRVCQTEDQYQQWRQSYSKENGF